MRWALAGLFLAGCAREVFDHAPQELGRDAGPDAGTAVVDCETAEPGSRCDDRNVCTPASTCRDQMCQAGTASRECLVAGTRDRAVDEQGKNGWYYGYWSAEQDEDGSYDSADDFSEMEYCDDGNWRPPGSASGPRRSGLPLDLEPVALAPAPETMPERELPIRRGSAP